MPDIQIKVGDFLVYTYRGRLELSQKEPAGFQILTINMIANLPDTTPVIRCVWKQDQPIPKSLTTLAKVRSKL